MKRIMPLIITSLLTLTTANAANVSVETNPYAANVKYDKVFIEVSDAGSYLTAAGTYIYHNPQAKNQYGYYKNIFINYTSGTQYCRALGHTARNTEGNGGQIMCGEDESSYVEYNFSNGRWESRSTGSANQCYPLYQTIECK